MVYPWFKNISFLFDPEFIHSLTLKSCSKYPGLSRLFPGKGELDNRYQVQVGDTSWPFPVGLAAGLDKNAQAIDFFAKLFFGAIEVGTVTPKAQPGNAKPRLFRLKKEFSLVNRMGFNNLGADCILANIKESSLNGRILGVNLGMNKDTSLEDAAADYKVLYRKFSPVADYLVANISSPNTVGLRDLEKVDALKKLLLELRPEREEKPCPFFIKVSPDISLEDLPNLVDIALSEKLTGFIATNTTVMPEWGKGGISGKLLYERAKKVRNLLLRLTKEENMEVIGVGGFSSMEDIWEFWQEGGKVVQLYTALIYKGPGLLEEIKKEIDRLLSLNKVNSLQELLKNIKDFKFADS